MILSKIALPLRSVAVRFFFSAEPREQVEYDVLIVGGGVAGLATAIRLKQK